MNPEADEWFPPGPAEDIPNHEIDWVWPAIDTFTDDTIARHPFHTCSELGSQRIRLVRIQAGPPDSIITLDTKICFLANAGDYTALSYTWGSPILQREVLVESRPVAITVSLYRFLSQARRLSARFPGWLWIDALSIDQSDPWERLEQVKIISEIFARARRTTVWLGPTFGNSSRAMKALDAVSRSTSPCKSTRSMWASPTGPALWALCERGYWRRLWVCQELKASKIIDVMCGNKLVAFKRLRDFVFVKRSDARVVEMLQILQQTSAAKMIALLWRFPDASLQVMLEKTSYLRYTDPLDRVYAILNLVTSGREGIEADYTITLLELINKVLSNMHELKSPRQLYLVQVECTALERSFAVELGSMYQVETAARTSDPEPSTALAHLAHRHWVTYDGTGPRMSEDVLVDLHRWCKRYGHKRITRLLHEQSEEILQAKQREHRRQSVQNLLSAPLKYVNPWKHSLGEYSDGSFTAAPGFPNMKGSSGTRARLEDAVPYQSPKAG